AAAHRRTRPGRRPADGIADGGYRAKRARSETAHEGLPREARRESEAAGMNAAALSPARAREVALGTADVRVDRRADGSILLQSPHPLSAYPQKLTERLVHWAREAPERTFIAQRDAAGEWRRLSYGDALRRVRSIGQALL